jgi:signal transduction histidine kinase
MQLSKKKYVSFFATLFYFCVVNFSLLKAQCFKIDSLQRALLVLQRKPDTTWVKTANRLSEEFFINKMYGQAEFYALQAQKTAVLINDQIGQGDALILLGNIYFKDDLKRDKDAINSYKKALEIFEILKNSEKIANAHKLIGDYYYNLYYLDNNFYKYALDNYLKALNHIEKSGNKYKTAEICVNIGSLYGELGEEKKSTEYFLKAVKLKTEIEDKDIDNPHLFSKAQRFYDLQIESQKNYLYIFTGGTIFLILVVGLLIVIASIKQKTNKQLTLQKQEILNQKKEIEIQKQELEESHKEIEQQRDELILKNKCIEEAQEEIRQANDALTEINAHLNDLVQLRTQEVYDKNEELTKVNEELDLLIYRASHDFKGPVATLTGLVQLAKITADPDNPSLEYIEKIEKTAQKMDEMLDKLHQISYLRGKNLENEKIDFHHIIQDIKHKFENLIQENQIEIITDIEADSFVGDYDTIYTIIENLVENAIVFRTQEPNKKPQITIKIKEHFDWVYISIKDNGVGIATEHLPKIYDMFFRGSELSKGNGLGLYLVKQSLERLHTHIEVESVENIYTDFHINLPKKY